MYSRSIIRAVGSFHAPDAGTPACSSAGRLWMYVLVELMVVRSKGPNEKC